MNSAFPLTRELVLIGGGHAHALVLRRWGMRPLPGARLTVINPSPTAPYTGMLPGFVAGHYRREELDIDLVRLARFAGARMIFGIVDGIDRGAKHILIPNRPPIAFDVASINIGIISDLPDVPGFNEHAIVAKPLGIFANRWQEFVQTAPEGAKIAVIGAGVGGVELALAMADALRDRAPQITVVDRSDALPGIAPRSREILVNRLNAAGGALIEQSVITKIEADAIHLADGRAVQSDFTVGAAGARPFEWLQGTGLDLDQGFIMVNGQLQSSDPSIFAAGDCAALSDPRPKAGVFAVREAPVLAHNLRVALRETGRMRAFRPQKRYLKLISLGERSALTDRWRGGLSGAWVWQWKDWIDQRFMTTLTDLPAMPVPALPDEHAAEMTETLGDKPMCGGCGAKVGTGVLNAVLTDMTHHARDDVARLPGDDAAVLTMGKTAQVLTTDHLRAFTEDPYRMARIAAVHALGDVWAMGAAPQAALASIVLPKMSEALQNQWLDEIMTGAAEVFSDAGAAIVGGHTTLGAELTVGFTVTGLAAATPIALANARPGDVLILTKPIGSGVIMAAEMQMRAKGAWVAAALDAMEQPQGKAARILSQAHAMTDVTGFGLAGHLMNICKASGVGAELNMSSIPTLAGAVELSQVGIRSTLFPKNRAVAVNVTLKDNPETDLLFDPQTAGGLLGAVAAKNAEDILHELTGAGYPAAIIGTITDGPAHITVV